MCELFNVAFGFALVFMKATLDTDTAVALFACVGRCFTVDALLTHGITTMEKEPLSALGAVPQSPLAGRALCHPRVAPLASPRPQGDVPTFQAGGSLTSPLQPAPALAFPRGSGRAAHATPGPSRLRGLRRAVPAGRERSPGVGGAGPRLPRCPRCPRSRQGHAPAPPRPPQPRCPPSVTSMAGPAGCRGGESAAPQPLPAPLHPPRAASASVIPARRLGPAVTERRPGGWTGGAQPRARCLGGTARVERAVGREVGSPADLVFSAF